MHFVQEETIQLESEFGGSCGDGGNWQIGDQDLKIEVAVGFTLM